MICDAWDKKWKRYGKKIKEIKFNKCEIKLKEINHTYIDDFTI